jgi:hypothetical protein
MVHRPALKPLQALSHEATPAEVGRPTRQGMHRIRGHVLR